MYSPFLVAFLPLPLFLPPLPFPLPPPHSNLLLHQLPSKLSLKILSAINLEFWTVWNLHGQNYLLITYQLMILSISIN